MPDSTLKNLIEHFSKYDLTLAAVPRMSLAMATNTDQEIRRRQRPHRAGVSTPTAPSSI